MRKALIEQATGKVANIIEIGAVTTWTPPSGYILIEPGIANIGDTWTGTQFIPRQPTEEELKAIKREEAKARFLAAIAVQTSPPWSDIFKDLAVALGLKEPS